MNGISVRRLTILVLAAGLGLLPRDGYSQDRPYIDPLFRLAVQSELADRLTRELPEGVSLDSTMAHQLMLVRPRRGAEPHLGVFVKLGTGGEAALRRHGALIGTRAGPWVTARVPVGALPELMDGSGIRALYAAPTARTTNDLASSDMRATDVRRRSGDRFAGFTGRGVVIGLVDTGLDLDHPDFVDAETGSSRVYRVWDQTISGTPPPGLSYGHECTQEAIDSGACPMRDDNGHGTHVAGSMAATGRATGNGEPAYQFTGVAPGATLVVVKTSASFDAIVDGVSYVYSVAELLGSPAVVNLSLGTDFGPHDGTQPFEQMLDALAGPGRLVVASAGNSGGHPVAVDGTPPDSFHAMGTVATGQQIDHPMEILGAGTSNDFIVLDIWYAGEDELSFQVTGPGGSTLSAQTGDGVVNTNTADGFIEIQAPATPDPENGDREALILLSGFASGTWSLTVGGVTSLGLEPYHVWAAFNTQPMTLRNASNSHLVGAPATANRTIAAGGYTTREVWESIAGGQFVFIGRSQVGQILPFSSPGPRRDNVLKPEITAPATAIISSLSGQASGIPEALIVPDGVHWTLQGTSMSSALASGAVALMLESDATLTPEDVIAVLQASGREDQFSQVSFADDAGNVGLPNHTWGNGKLDVFAALQQIVGTNASLAILPGDATPPPERIPRGAQEIELLSFDLNAGPDFVKVSDLTVAAEGTLDFAGLVERLVVEPFGIEMSPDGLGGFVLADTLFASPNSTTTVRLIADLVLGGEIGDEGRLVLTGVEAEGGVSAVPLSQSGLTPAGWLRRLDRGEVALQVSPLAPPPPDRLLAASVVPLLQVFGTTDSLESMTMSAIALTTEVDDPALRLYVVEYQVGDPAAFPGTPGDTVYRSEIFVSDRAGTAFGDPSLTLDLPIGGWSYEVGAILSPAAAHGSPVRLGFDQAETEIAGVLSGDEARRVEPPAPLVTERGPIDLLESDDAFGVSANPVRGSRVVLTFGTRPRAVSVFNFAGERVRSFDDDDIEGLLDGPARVVWEPLTNDRGSDLANGVYVVVIEHTDGRAQRQRLMILRGAR